MPRHTGPFLIDALRALATRPGGFTTDAPELILWRTRTIEKQVYELRVAGEIVSAHGGERRARYFGRQEWADAWLACVRRPARPAPVRVIADMRPTGAVIVPAGLVVTVCPAYAPRFEAIEVPGAPRVYWGGHRCA